MNEEILKIIVDQKRDIENLNNYVDAGFKLVCDRGKKDRKSINFLSFCAGFMAFKLFQQNLRIKRLEKQMEESKNNIINDPVENEEE